jgi:uncharacterized membrane protein
MATLLAITYPDPDRAERAMQLIDWYDFDRLVDVKAACWISKENGELKVHPRGHPVAGKAALGGALGLLVGALFALPVAGVAAGAALGARRGKKKDTGIDEKFVESVGAQLESGGSAIVVLYEAGADNQKAAVDLAQYGGQVHSADLPSDTLAQFQAMLDEANRDMASSGGDAIAE